MRMSGNLQLPKALRERRYRRNWFVRFYRQPVRTATACTRLPRRLRLLAMTNLKACTLDGLPGNLQLPKALTERRYIFLSRSGLVQRAPLQTQLVFTFLSVACTNRQCSAGRDMSLPYNARPEALCNLLFSIFRPPYAAPQQWRATP